jgi:hypothetical protein
MKSRAKLLCGDIIEIETDIRNEDGKLTVLPIINDRSDIDYIDVAYDFAEAEVGDYGYYILPRGTNTPDDHICLFTERSDGEIDTSNFQMTMFGYVHNSSGWCAIVTGYTYEYHVIIGKKGDRYYMYPRFYLGGDAPYESISIEYRLLDGKSADYSGAARAYRDYMLENGYCKPIKERLSPELDYAKDSIYVRIRHAWKPVPSPIEEQTVENEPPLHVAIDFKKTGELMERCKAAGIEKAEFCLVGWNKSGHDGRYPQMFPVEPLLGGEEGLRELIAKARSLGYQITCHTNSTDSYSIADIYSPDITRKNKDGSIAQHGTTWGGGRAKWVCAKKGLEIAQNELPKVAELGFRGLHYIDVISTIPCSPCYDPNHPLTRRETAEYYKETAKLAKELFGGFSSEGGYDHTMPYIDYGLYISFYDTETAKIPPFFSKPVPIWQIAYHGIMLSNPYTTTVNAPIKSRRRQLEAIERGGRPTAYIYSKFKSDGKSWMGSEDLICTTEEDMEKTIQVLAEMYREFAPMSYLQTEFIEQHDEIAPGVYKITYSDGSKITVDYNEETYTLER